MAFVFHRDLAIPLWTIALCAVVLTSPPPQVPSVTALVSIAVLATMMMVMLPWLRTLRPLVALPAAARRARRAGGLVIVAAAGVRVRPFDAVQSSRRSLGATADADALDLVRMDGDGSWGVASERSFKDSKPAGLPQR